MTTRQGTDLQASPTPGPWEFSAKLSASENHKGFFIRAEKATKNGKWALAEVQPGDEDGKLGQANARLIAAAPDLLEALKALSDMYARIWDRVDGALVLLPDSIEKFEAAHSKAMAAIAKANK